MNALAQGVFQDLRDRRLLPVAALLLIVLVAVPVFMLKKSEPAPAPVVGTSVAPTSADGLPTPQQALSTDKPLVSLAVLEDPSSLSTYRRRNPFKPTQSLDGSGAATETAATTGVGQTPAAGTDTGGDTATAGTPSGGSSGGGGTPTTSTPTATTPQTTQPDSDATPKNQPKPKTEKLTYALDLKFRSPRGGRTYKSVARLRMLPSSSRPLFVYLGVDTTGTKAVFLVDSSLAFEGGEGSCSPERTSCATVSLQPGEIATFRNAGGETFELEVAQIREVSASAAASSARKAAKADRAGASASSTKSRRFMPPVINDLFTRTTR